MLYFGMLFVTLTMLFVITAVGLRVCDLLPFKLRSVGRGYFSPLLGLAVFVFIAVINGWLVHFRQSICGAVTIPLVVFSLWREKSPRLRVGLFGSLLLFTLVVSGSVLFPILRYEAFNPFTDAFTYLEHAQWLQTHSFSEVAVASGYHPEVSQVRLYQANGHRMAASFYLAWVQATFDINWSYYAYPPAVLTALVSGSIAVAGVVILVVRRQRFVAHLAACATATTLNGWVFGAQYGFFPQTFGLVFALGSLALIGGSTVLLLRRFRLGQSGLPPALQSREMAVNAIPPALTAGTLATTYNDLMPFIVVSLFGFLCFLAFLHRSLIFRILVFWSIIAAEALLIVNFEVLRIANNFFNTMLGAASGRVHFGWPVLWRPWEFAAHSFGLKSSIQGMWLFRGEWVTAFALLGLVAAISYATKRQWRRVYFPESMALYFIALCTFAAGFAYFRYLVPSLEANEVGFTFAQFKLAKWASPVAFVIAGVTAAYYARLSRVFARLIPALLIICILLGLSANFSTAQMNTGDFNQQTGYDRDGFSSLLQLRELARGIPKDDIIYLNLGDVHHKLRQMIAYVLPDHRLSSDYTDDGYILGSLPADERVMPLDQAKWVIDFVQPGSGALLGRVRAGNVELRPRPASLVTLTSIEEGHSRETDGVNWWNWSSEKLVYRFKVVGHPAHVRFRFTYMPISLGRTLSINVDSPSGVTRLAVPMEGGRNRFVSPPIELSAPQASVTLVSDGQPVRLSATDPRMAAFLIENFQVVEEDSQPGSPGVESEPAPKSVQLVSVSGGYDREVDGSDWRYWTGKELEFRFKIPPSLKSGKIKFTYLPGAVNGTMSIQVLSKRTTLLSTKMKNGWNDYLSPSLPIDGQDLTVRLTSDKPAIRLSATDSRMVAFLIQNLELLETNAPPPHEFNLVSVKGGYDRENDGQNWRYWTAKDLEFTYTVPIGVKSARLKFTYLPAVADATLKVQVSSRKESGFSLPMKGAWNDHLSAPMDVEGPNVTIRFSSDKPPVRLSATDARMAVFLIQNLELMEASK